MDSRFRGNDGKFSSLPCSHFRENDGSRRAICMALTANRGLYPMPALAGVPAKQQRYLGISLVSFLAQQRLAYAPQECQRGLLHTFARGGGKAAPAAQVYFVPALRVGAGRGKVALIAVRVADDVRVRDR